MKHENYVQKKIQRVAIFEDNPGTRVLLAGKVEDADLTPIVQDKPIASLEVCIQTISDRGSAAIFDNDLSQHNSEYANFRGILAVSRLYLLFFPALLVSSYEANILEIREYRQHVPVILKPAEVTPDSIIKGFEICQNEFAGKFTSERKPWRSLVRVDEITENKKSVYVVIPSWNASEKILLPTSLFPVQDERIEGMRFFAKVNIGAENYSDLYCYNIELADKPIGRYAKLLHS